MRLRHAKGVVLVCAFCAAIVGLYTVRNGVMLGIKCVKVAVHHDLETAWRQHPGRVFQTPLYAECNGTLLMTSESQVSLPVVFALTATYTRSTQKAELTRLGQTLMHVRNFCWIVIEDSHHRTNLVSNLLLRMGVAHVQLAISGLASKPGYPFRGQLQRQSGLTWIRQNVNKRTTGVLYVMDDDNTYDIRVFEEMRYTMKVSIFPVGIVGDALFETPVVKNGRIVQWAVRYNPKERKFPVDFAGFAVNIKVFLNNPTIIFSAVNEEQEITFLEQFAKISDFEPRAKNCTQVLVWHTRTVRPFASPYSPKELEQFNIEPMEV